METNEASLSYLVLLPWMLCIFQYNGPETQTLKNFQKRVAQMKKINNNKHHYCW